MIYIIFCCGNTFERPCQQFWKHFEKHCQKSISVFLTNMIFSASHLSFPFVLRSKKGAAGCVGDNFPFLRLHILLCDHAPSLCHDFGH